MSWFARILTLGTGFLVIAGSSLAWQPPVPSGTMALDEIETVGQRIDRGLVPPLRIEGRPVEPRRLEPAMAESGVPALALAVIDDCDVVWSGGWGTLEDGATKVSGSTPFQVASVSKTVTATVVMTMVADGKLDLDQPVNELLREWRLPENELTREQPVLVRHLLSHSAGLTRTGYWFDRAEPLPPLAAILSGEVKNPAIEVEELPGVRSVPSNSGFLVLQALVEEVSGMSLAALAEKRLFTPLEMASSAFEPVSEVFLERGAVNHGRDGSAMDGKAPLIPGAPGGLWSSAEDLALLLAELMSAWQGRSEELLPRDIAREMLSPQVGDMALGMHTRGEDEAFNVQQAGGGIGSRSHMIGYPGRCQGAAIVVNTDAGRRVVAETLASVGQEFGWPDLPLRVAEVEVAAENLAPLAGRYEYDAAPGSSVTFTVEGEELRVRFGDRAPLSLIAASGSVFVWPGSALEMRFDAPVAGKAPGVTIGTAGLYRSHLSRVGAAGGQSSEVSSGPGSGP